MTDIDTDIDPEDQIIQIGKMTLMIDKRERLHFRDVRGRDQTYQLARGDETLVAILDAAIRGSGTPPPPPPPDTTRVEPPSNLVDPNNINSTSGQRAEDQARYRREVAAIAPESK